MIVLWGIAEERPLAAVADALAALGKPVFVLDQRAALELSIEVTFDGGAAGRLVSPVTSLDLAEITAIYLRPYPPTDLAAIARRGVGSPGWNHALAVHQALRAWTEVTKARVVNRVTAMASNTSKPYQLGLLRDLGFAVPETVVTTDPEVARVFLDDHVDVIYKSVSDVRSVVARVTPEHRERLAAIAGCPTQFQAYVAGTDVRVHVVGDRLFPVEIETDAVDYRYPGDHEVRRRPTTLPPEIGERCLTAAKGLGLALAGIDLRRSADDTWYCFEVNPSPAFTYYDEGGQIARAIAELLSEGGSP